MAATSIGRYVPAGPERYVVRPDGRMWWWAVLAGVVPVLAFTILVLATAGGVVVVLVPVAMIWLIGLMVVHLIRSGDAAGIMLAIDERGIYFGKPPSELIAWPDVAEVILFEEADEGSTIPMCTVRRTGVRPADASDRCAGGIFLNHQHVRRALVWHAPSEVLITDRTGAG